MKPWGHGDRGLLGLTKKQTPTWEYDLFTVCTVGAWGKGLLGRTNYGMGNVNSVNLRRMRVGGMFGWAEQGLRVSGWPARGLGRKGAVKERGGQRRGWKEEVAG